MEGREEKPVFLSYGSSVGPFYHRDRQQDGGCQALGRGNGQMLVMATDSQ